MDFVLKCRDDTSHTVRFTRKHARIGDYLTGLCETGWFSSDPLELQLPTTTTAALIQPLVDFLQTGAIQSLADFLLPAGATLAPLAASYREAIGYLGVTPFASSVETVVMQGLLRYDTLRPDAVRQAFGGCPAIEAMCDCADMIFADRDASELAALNEHSAHTDVLLFVYDVGPPGGPSDLMMWFTINTERLCIYDEYSFPIWLTESNCPTVDATFDAPFAMLSATVWTDFDAERYAAKPVYMSFDDLDDIVRGDWTIEHGGTAPTFPPIESIRAAMRFQPDDDLIVKLWARGAWDTSPTRRETP
jgi:hypothetical protein